MKQQNYNVLIVDDNEQNRILLSKILTKQNCNTYLASDGNQALEIDNLIKMDLILLDIGMPGTDGYEICRLLKKDKKTQDIPVIFISALSRTSDIVEGFNAGGVDYISKPFQIEEVVARVMVHLQLKQKTNELDRTIERLVRTQTELYKSKRLASLGVLTAGLAHEINNPVNFIYTGINGLKQDYEDIEPLLQLCNEKIKCKCPEFEKLSNIKKDIDLDEILKTIPQAIEDIQYGAKRTSEIVKGLKTFSHPDTESKQPTNIHDSINSCLVLLKNKLTEDITIIKNFDNNLDAILAFSGELSQVFLNIINNAIDAFSCIESIDKKPDFKKTIRIETRKKDKQIEIIIKDNGPGISEDILEHIFDPFFTTKKMGEGTGLGLSICYGITKKHDGKISVESKVGQGTRFSVKLPINIS